MAQCMSCHRFVVFETAVCATCRQYPNNLRVVRDDIVHATVPVPEEWKFHSRMIKGKLAETLVEQLFISHKYNVYRYGMAYGSQRNTLTVVKKLRETSSAHGKLPDFVVQHRHDKETFFVDVRFRSTGYFTARDLDKEYHHPYDNTLIIVVSPENIKCLSVAELRTGKMISPDCRNLLSERSEFQLRKDVVRDFTILVSSYKM